MKTLTIGIDQKKIHGTIRLPASKSISNRALIIQFLMGREIPMQNLSTADDTLLMQSLLLNIQYHVEREKSLLLDCQNAGTVLRFLTAVLSITSGDWILMGSPRMKERPVAILVRALQQVGADIEYMETDGYPPLHIKGRPLMGGKVDIDGSVSSQYISALMMIGPLLENGLILNLKNKISSLPYINMTRELLKRFSIHTSFSGSRIEIPKQSFKSNTLIVEPDWSAAAFWYEIAALAHEAEIFLEQLRQESLQGDAILPEIYKHFGIRTEFNEAGVRLFKEGPPYSTFAFDFSNNPDLALPVIITCAGLGIKGRFTGLESLRIKESDRIAALQSELQKLGFNVELASNDVLLTHSTKNRRSNNPVPEKMFDIQNSIHSFSDHRMAMSFAPLALVMPPFQIKNPHVVSKSYPGFWQDLSEAGFSCKF
jgi:3-phosphoshikimate 1-carboxyvinyltransferase